MQRAAELKDNQGLFAGGHFGARWTAKLVGQEDGFGHVLHRLPALPALAL